MRHAVTIAAILAAVITLPAIAQDVKSAATTAQTAISDQEAKTWVGKHVYSSDGKNLGEVAAILRTADNKITELRADIGGFLGLGQHEISVPAARFYLKNDRVELDMTAAQAKEFPKVAK
jgi:ribosomal 30S subunit maturation factor RimM